MIGVERTLDAWCDLAGLLSGGVLGLFALSLLSRRPVAPQGPWPAACS